MQKFFWILVELQEIEVRGDDAKPGHYTEPAGASDSPTEITSQLPEDRLLYDRDTRPLPPEVIEPGASGLCSALSPSTPQSSLTLVWAGLVEAYTRPWRMI
ncbi:hypothetical protein KOW79_011770 [Hemibagrus wyckioides]|uniref:Uncharacterized protein n=1 Tax=Hemibagrus wyckioides TaxID=337641 RepID=A0A9D3NNY3_9TELE|nr:hypothetical protein KOW79_011770 [Hemibagrus wyckioides]